MGSGCLEIEATLVICSEKPQAVADQIAALTRIGNYPLLPQDPKAIHDLYLDTPDRALQARELAVRIREVGRLHWITLKGPRHPTDWGGVERLEIETLWSEKALTEVLKELMDRGIEVPQRQRHFESDHPLSVMMSLGWEVVQNRRSHRQIRNIVLTGDESGQGLAEMAIDSVLYHFGYRDIGHHEVEIEAKVKDGSAVIKAVIEGLMAMYGSALRAWDHSKQVTGEAIERLLRQGALAGLTDANNNLKPVVYDKIQAYLEHRYA